MTTLADFEGLRGGKVQQRTHRQSVAAPSQVDQVIRAPEGASSGLVVIRSFCRFPPLESEMAKCRRPEPLYYYDVASAACLPFYGGHCQRSRNRFRTEKDCMQTCVVSTQGFVTKASDRSDADRVHGLIRQLSARNTVAAAAALPHSAIQSSYRQKRR